MAVQLPQVEATVELRLRVPRGAVGDLVGGVEDVLGTVEGVRDVDVREVTDMRPAPADIYVDARVTLAVALETDDCDAVRAHVGDGFGVERVDAVTLVG
jgi:hypothetical protein